MSAPPSKPTQPSATTFNERLNEQLINCLNVQTNVIQNLAQYSQHISLQLFDIKNIVEILSNRVLVLQQQQQQQSHFPPNPYPGSYHPNYMPPHQIPVPHPPPPSHPPSVPFPVQPPMQTRLPTSNPPPPPNASFPFFSSNPANPLHQPPPPPPPQTAPSTAPSYPFSTSVANTLPPTTTTPTKPLFPNMPKFTAPDTTTKTTPSSSSSGFPTTSSTNEKPSNPSSAAPFKFGTGNSAPVFGTGNGTSIFGTGNSLSNFGTASFGSALSNISVTKQETNADDQGEEEDEEDSYEPNDSFKPIITLSAVEVKTGEEDENVLFCERGKLYRFEASKNEMKERGTGEMKILQHKTTNVCRVLMRREQVLKICANHQITSQMDLKPHSGAANAYIWSAMDFADGEPKHETLCVRFKTEEQAKNFAKVFNEAKQNNAKKAGDSASATKTSASEQTKPKAVSDDNDDDVISIGEVKPSAEQIDKAKKLQLPSTFYLYENKEPCKGCAGCEEDTPPAESNENQKSKPTEAIKTDSKASAPQSSLATLVSKTPLSSSENINFSFTSTGKSQPTFQKQTSIKEEKPTGESSAPTTPSQNEAKPSIFGNFNGASGSSIFGSSTPLNSNPTVFGSTSSFKPAADGPGGFAFPGFGPSTESSTPSVGFQFSTPTSTSASTTPAANPSSTFSFGTNGDKPVFGNGPKFSFADLAKQSSNDKSISNGSEQRVFAGQGAPIFGTGVVSTPTAAAANDDDEGEGGGEDDSYEPNVSFKPIVQLSAVDVKSGEEDENVLFCERGKLYRFDPDTNQMKERGIGEMKILQHKTKNTCRVLMRREQVLKLCANHTITPQMDLKPHSGTENAYVWSAMDYAEGELKHETFCVRFKSSDAANRFFKQFNDAKQINANAQQ